ARGPQARSASEGTTSPKRQRGDHKPEAPARGPQARSASEGTTSPKRQRGDHKPEAPARGPQARSASEGRSGAGKKDLPRWRFGLVSASPRWRFGLVSDWPALSINVPQTFSTDSR